MGISVVKLTTKASENPFLDLEVGLLELRHRLLQLESILLYVP